MCRERIPIKEVFNVIHIGILGLRWILTLRTFQNSPVRFLHNGNRLPGLSFGLGYAKFGRISGAETQGPSESKSASIGEAHISCKNMNELMIWL